MIVALCGGLTPAVQQSAEGLSEVKLFQFVYTYSDSAALRQQAACFVIDLMQQLFANLIINPKP